ncbi:phage holin family protein [Solimicrobium silvestre]|uniref:Putative membrane protein n=1 Tax=Solimicrobium silvestre TaxID=2099400 RepID=A0A2S9GV61_9BURK|nr:phage holin family protein [Solimicrobium silvestre]PRC91546.1 putative membrane protein [Solimicrobium silvestre]
MTISATINRIISTVVAMLYTRLELVTVELEEEFLRFSSYFIYALIALFCGGVAVSLLIFLVIALFWDEHRVAVLLSLIAVFSAISIYIAAWLRTQMSNKPRLLEQTIAELKKDAELLRVRESDSEQEPS